MSEMINGLYALINGYIGGLLSRVKIDTDKDWNTKKIENIGAPDTGDDAKRHDSSPEAHKTSHQNADTANISVGLTRHIEISSPIPKWTAFPW